MDGLIERLSERPDAPETPASPTAPISWQAFSFTRMVEAYRPDYLHSYFFYDRSLMALVAGYLLGHPPRASAATPITC